MLKIENDNHRIDNVNNRQFSSDRGVASQDVSPPFLCLRNLGYHLYIATTQPLTPVVEFDQINLVIARHFK